MSSSTRDNLLGSTTILSLPDEVIDHIMSFLPSFRPFEVDSAVAILHEDTKYVSDGSSEQCRKDFDRCTKDLKHLCMTNRRLRNLARPRLFASVVIQVGGSDLALLNLLRLPEVHPLILRLRIQILYTAYAPPLPHSFATLLIEQCLSLQLLILDGIYPSLAMLEAEQIPSRLLDRMKTLPNLKALKLVGLILTLEVDFELKSDSVTHLGLHDDNPEESIPEDETSFEHEHNLQALYLSGWPNLRSIEHATDVDSFHFEGVALDYPTRWIKVPTVRDETLDDLANQWPLQRIQGYLKCRPDPFEFRLESLRIGRANKIFTDPHHSYGYHILDYFSGAISLKSLCITDILRFEFDERLWRGLRVPNLDVLELEALNVAWSNEDRYQIDQFIISILDVFKPKRYLRFMGAFNAIPEESPNVPWMPFFFDQEQRSDSWMDRLHGPTKLKELPLTSDLPTETTAWLDRICGPTKLKQLRLEEYHGTLKVKVTLVEDKNGTHHWNAESVCGLNLPEQWDEYLGRIDWSIYDPPRKVYPPSPEMVESTASSDLGQDSEE